MAITYPLTQPTTKIPSRVHIRQRAVVARTMSIFTGIEQVFAHQGQWWEADVSLPPLLEADAEEWLAWGIQLNGVEGTFLMGDPSRPNPRGSALNSSASPVVSGSSHSGYDLTLKSGPTSTTGFLLAGDWLQLGSSLSSRLFKVLKPVDFNSSGHATVTLWPKLNSRNTPADNDPVVLTSAKGLWRLTAPIEWSRDVIEYGLSFACKSIP